MIFNAGIWGRVGGASGECKHAVYLWRKYGLDVTMIPTWQRADSKQEADCAQMGCGLVNVSARQLAQVPGLRGSTVVSFGNDNFLLHISRFKELGCRLVYAPLMCYVRQAERTAFSRGIRFDAVVCQSEYQRSLLEPAFTAMGQPSGTFALIRGAMAWWLPEWRFEPRGRAQNEPFHVGRFARAQKSKWHRDYWAILGRIPNVRATLMGVDEALRRYLGNPPPWATCLKPGAVDPATLYRELHAILAANSTDHENFPRIGLEAAACGIPVVAENQWGWKELVSNGETGLLYNSPVEASELATRLAADESFRLRIAVEARNRLESSLAEPGRLWEQWREVLGA